MTPERWQQIERAFHEVAAAPELKRAALLDRLCGGDASLRAEVAALIAADTAAGPLTRAIIDEAVSVAAGELSGRRLGPYVVVRLLGRGGMGAVYLAVRADDEYHKEVAVKVLPRGLDTSGAIGRFRRERQILAGLEHPNIAALLDGGSTEDGLPFLVMEYVQGRPLLEHAKTLDVPAKLELFLDVASAVTHAHDHQVVHRDIKPANILVTSDGRPKLLDFGIAKLLVGDGEGPPSATTTLAFTPEYASPEQIRGETATPATDVYALGALLYELLSDARAHVLRSPELSELTRVVCDEPPPLASSVAPASLRRELRGDLDTIVMKALQKEPGRRYASVAALAEDVRRYLSHQPVLARRDSAWYRLSRLFRRNRAVLGAGVVTTIVVATLSFGIRGAGAPDRRAATDPPPAPPKAPPFAPRNARRVTFDDGCEEFPSWTKDGAGIVYDGQDGDVNTLFLADPASGTRRVATGMKGHFMAAAVSPRGGEVVYLDESATTGGTYVAALDGNASRKLSDRRLLRPSWSPDGAFVWAERPDGLTRIDARSGETSRVVHNMVGNLTAELLELADGRVVTLAFPYARAQSGVVLYGRDGSEGTWLWREDLEEVLELSPEGTSVLVSRSPPSQNAELFRVPLDGSPPEPVAASGVRATKGLRLSPDRRAVAWSTCLDHHEIDFLTDGVDAGVLVAQPHGGSSEWVDEEPRSIPGTSSLLVMSSRTGRFLPCVVDVTAQKPARCIDLGGLQATQPSPSADGRWFSFHVLGKGVFVAPLDGSSPPRQLTESPGETQLETSISPDGTEVYFTQRTDEGKSTITSNIEAVPFAGGPARRVTENNSRYWTFSPKGDTAVFSLSTNGQPHRLTIVDLTTHVRRLLSKELADDGAYSYPVFSASGRRVAFLHGTTEVIEVDVASGHVTRRFDSRDGEISGITYAGEEIVISRVSFVGDVWVADL